MERSYWEKIAPQYNEEIFDVLANDRQSLIRAAVLEAADPGKTVLDAGCAIGKWLPVLAPVFGKVIAADISAANLDIAREHHPQFSNIHYLRTDLSSAKRKLPRCEVVLCVNAILTGKMIGRTHFIHNLRRCLVKGGRLILVVPSLESWLLTRTIQQHHGIDKALFAKRPAPAEGARRYQLIQQGVVEIDDKPTKHYLKEELEFWLTRNGFSVLRARKIEYPWKTEFVRPPRWLKQPQPWDWMVVAEKI